MTIRWKNSLCGSAIKPAKEMPSVSETLLSQNTQVLTCGGSYLPQKANHTPVEPTMATARNSMVFLPKDNYSILVVEGSKGVARYEEMENWVEDEIELSDEEMVFLDPKFHK